MKKMWRSEKALFSFSWSQQLLGMHFADVDLRSIPFLCCFGAGAPSCIICETWAWSLPSALSEGATRLHHAYLAQHVLHVSTQPLTPEQSVCSLLLSVFTVSPPVVVPRGVVRSRYRVAFQVCWSKIVAGRCGLFSLFSVSALQRWIYSVMLSHQQGCLHLIGSLNTVVVLFIHSHCISCRHRLQGATIICGMWLFWICGAQSQPPPSFTSVSLPTGACSGRRFSLFSRRLSLLRIMVKTCSPAVPCKDISRLRLRLLVCVATAAILSKSPRLWMHLCCCIICMQVRYHIARFICPGKKNGVWQARPQSLLETSFLSSWTTSLTFTQEQCGSTGARYHVNAQPVFNTGPSLSRVILILTTAATVVILAGTSRCVELFIFWYLRELSRSSEDWGLSAVSGCEISAAAIP